MSIKKTFVYFLAGLMFLLNIFAFIPSVSAENNSVFRVGMDVNYAPFNWSQVDDKNGAYPVSNSAGEFANGYDVEIAKKIADSLGKKLEIIKTDWNGLAPGLMSNKFDAVIAGMSPTEERKQKLDFTDSYYKTDLVIVVKKEGKYATAKSLDDFKGAKVTGQLNTYHYDCIDQIPGVEKLSAMEDFPTMIVALKSGKIDAYLSEKPGAIAACDANSELTYINFDQGKGFKVDESESLCSIATAKGSPLVAEINKVLAGISQEEREALMLDKMKLSQSTEDEVKKNEGDFVVAMEVDYAPFNFSQRYDINGAQPVSNSSGEYANGYDVQIAKKIADGLGRKLVIVKTDWDGLAPGVMSGKYDAIIAGMSPTAERREQIDFSDKYYTSDLVVVVKKGSKFEGAKSLKDLSGARITAQLNTFHYTVIDQIPGVEKQVAMENFPTMLAALDADKIDGYISERPGALSAAASNPNVTYIEFDKENGFKVDENDTSIAVGLAKGSPLTEKINSILSGISETERQKLMDEQVKLQLKKDEMNFWQATSYLINTYGPQFLRGAGVTLLISIATTLIGFVIGLIISIIKCIPKAKGIKRVIQVIVNALLNIYIEIFRSTPMIVQAVLFYYGSKIFFNIDIEPLTAALLVVSINTGAYLSEVVRGGIMSIDQGQFEGAKAIGMTHTQTMMYVVLPQAIRNILPAIGNEFVINIKDTAVLNVISVTELFFTSKSVAGSTFRIFESYFITCVIYFVLTFTITRIIRLFEKKLSADGSYTLVKGDQLSGQE